MNVSNLICTAVGLKGRLNRKRCCKRAAPPPAMSDSNAIHQLYARALQDNTVLAQQLAVTASERDLLMVRHVLGEL